MERKVEISVSEQDQSLQATEQTRQALGSRALVFECCGREKLSTPMREAGHVPVKVSEHGKPRQSRPTNVEVVTVMDRPSRILAEKANLAEKNARLAADHSFYRAIVRRRTESS